MNSSVFVNVTSRHFTMSEIKKKPCLLNSNMKHNINVRSILITVMDVSICKIFRKSFAIIVPLVTLIVEKVRQITEYNYYCCCLQHRKTAGIGTAFGNVGCIVLNNQKLFYLQGSFILKNNKQLSR